MEFVFAALMGWCGTRWWRWPWPGPGPGPDPDPWYRGLRDGLIGAVIGAVTYAALGAHFTSAGMIGIALLGFSGGKVGADILGGAIDMLTTNRQ